MDKLKNDLIKALKGIPDKDKAQLCNDLALIVAQKWSPFYMIGDGQALEALAYQTLDVYLSAHEIYKKETGTNK